MNKITVLLCDDHTLVRQGVRALLATAHDIAVIGEATNGNEAVSEAKRLNPQVVLMDISMPGLDGMAAIQKIAVEIPGAKVLILSSYDDDQSVRQAAAAGAAGYLTKEAASEDLLRAVRETSEGNSFFSPPIASRLVKQWRNRHLKTTAPALTLRQTQVLQMIAEGYSTKEIGSQLSLSKKTVDKHRQSLMNELDLHNIAKLTRYALSSGVVKPHYVPDWEVAPNLRAMPKSRVRRKRPDSDLPAQPNAVSSPAGDKEQTRAPQLAVPALVSAAKVAPGAPEMSLSEN